jgi:hypothetical protein
MALLVEKEIRAYQLKNKTFICPICASDEEKTDVETKAVGEDVIHDTTSPVECARCKKRVM